MIVERWEHGSEFHWPDIPASVSPALPWVGRCAYFGSGRDALRALLEHGRERCGWRRLWMPSYFCQEVVEATATPGVDLLFYADAPDAIPDFRGMNAKSGDVLFATNYFGLRGRLTVPKGIALIEDHTHDPWSDWSQRSDADFCLVSLRKTLPIPDGGVVWSPRGHPFPPPRAVTPERASASANKAAGMLLKRMYLDGLAVPKEKVRKLQLSGEANIASGEVSGMPPLTEALLDVLPANEWRMQRRRNHRTFSERFGAARPGTLTILRAAPNVDAVPFSIVLIVDSADRRDALRQGLIERHVYPAVLWPLEGLKPDQVPDAHVELSRRMLSLHCDFRYTDSDMTRLADLVLDAEQAAA